jgi:hypothetical protein
MVIFCGITSKICAICFFDTQIVSATEEIKTIQGRINSINLDATKNQIGFKVKNEGNEIHLFLKR